MIKIRLATIDDARSLCDIYAYYVINFPYSFEYTAPDEDEFSRRIKDVLSFFPFFVCEESDNILGFAYAHKYKERKAYQWICETSIYVRHNIIQKGIGTALYNELLPCLKKQGFTKVFAVLGCPNTGSELFHQKMGFTHLATFPDMGYKFDCWHDVKYYVLNLNPVTGNLKEPIPYSQI